ncbi:MAG: PAS domain S-box protein [Candidatus Omnitrophica bacterium]|nr:PAS domain S-box protein [Candidatus Omnitrophota bacterium]
MPEAPVPQNGPELKFKAIVEEMPDGIIVVDRKREIVLVNARAEQIFGYSRRELLGKPVEVLVPEHLRAPHVQHCRHFFEHSRTRPMGTGMDLYGVTKDGRKIPVDIRLAPLKTAQEDLVIATVREITPTPERKDHAL